MKNVCVMLVLVWAMLGAATTVWGQTAQGLVRDAVTNEPLVGASVGFGAGGGVLTDSAGRFTAASFPLVVSYLGYETVRVGKPTAGALVVRLMPTASVLETVTVSGSLYEKNFAKESVAIEVVRAEFLNKQYFNSLADVLSRVPGVQVLDEQVNIRSSGYSYGAGSRVAVILDDQPLLGGLESDIKWGFLPTENIEQIEVVKGAASVLYGASAVNGVIHFRTAQATAQPVTTASVYGSLSDAPTSRYRQWWNADSLRPSAKGAFVAHRQRFGKLDVVVGGHAHHVTEHIETVTEKRYRANLGLTYRLRPQTRLGLNVSTMRTEMVSYLLWLDADSNALRPIEPNTAERYHIYSIDPFFSTSDKNENKHTLKGRLFNAVLKRGDGKPDAPALTTSLDYQFAVRSWERWQLTTGVFGQYIEAQIPKVARYDSSAFDVKTGTVAALYAQAERDWLDGKWRATVGLRTEYFRFATDERRLLPMPRLGLVHQPSANGVWRANFGGGYRIPSLIERYASSQLLSFDVPIISGIYLIPNEDILPEVGWSSELGYKHLLKTTHWNGYLDVALFQNDYENLTEVLFDFHSDQPIVADPEAFGFKMVNIHDGRIAGIELSGLATGRWARGLQTRLLAGYTYSYPADLDSVRSRGMNYYGNWFKAFSMGNDTALIQTVLPYSTTHSGRLDVEVGFRSRVTLGFAANYFGYVHKVEDYFSADNKWAKAIYQITGDEIFQGYTTFRENSKGGDWVFDVRLAVQVSRFAQLNFMVNNLLNREYATRPGRMNPLRTFNVKLNFRL